MEIDAPNAANATASTARHAPADACPACGGQVTPAQVSTALWEGDTLAIVQDVPALVCGGCHERYFEDDTVMRLDLMRAGGFARQRAVARMDVPVYAFAPSSPAGGEGTA